MSLSGAKRNLIYKTADITTISKLAMKIKVGLKLGTADVNEFRYVLTSSATVSANSIFDLAVSIADSTVAVWLVEIPSTAARASSYKILFV